jgi:Flp pilus assembly protein TadD/TolB-like protein
VLNWYLRTLVLLLVAGGAAFAHAARAGETLVILPFENQSRTPNLEWIGDSFPETVGQKMVSRSLYVVGRQERLSAFDRLGIPTSLRPSRATSYRLAREMDADYVVFGRYYYDGARLRVTAQLLKMGALRLTPVVSQSGPLPSLIDLQTALAGDLLRLINPDFEEREPLSGENGSEPRVEAFEQYIRGLTAGTPPEQISHFKEALRLNPAYSEAMLQLGRAYYAARDYAGAASWLAKIPKAAPLALEAGFHLGMAAYYGGDFQHAESAFAFLSSKMGLSEFYNDLGVVSSRRGKQNALEHFRKAVEVDPHDPDLRFNLAVSLYRNGDAAGAQTQLRHMLSLRSNDREARALLDSLTTNAVSTGGGQTPLYPLERIKRSYDEELFRRLSFEPDHEPPVPPADHTNKTTSPGDSSQ